MPPNTIYVGRGSKWGNPFIIGLHGNRQQCVTNFERLISGFVCVSENNVDEQLKLLWWPLHIHELRGHNLACWCQDGKPCHADLWLELANA